MKAFSAELVSKSKGTLVAPSEIMSQIKILAPEAIVTLEALMKGSKADSVRLKAALEILALAGYTKENKITITRTEEMDEKALDSRLGELLSSAVTTVIDGESVDITPEKAIESA
jgi:hypothetical protein